MLCLNSTRQKWYTMLLEVFTSFIFKVNCGSFLFHSFCTYFISSHEDGAFYQMVFSVLARNCCCCRSRNLEVPRGHSHWYNNTGWCSGYNEDLHQGIYEEVQQEIVKDCVHYQSGSWTCLAAQGSFQYPMCLLFITICCDCSTLICWCWILVDWEALELICNSWVNTREASNDCHNQCQYRVKASLA